MSEKMNEKLFDRYLSEAGHSRADERDSGCYAVMDWPDGAERDILLNALLRAAMEPLVPQTPSEQMQWLNVIRELYRMIRNDTYHGLIIKGDYDFIRKIPANELIRELKGRCSDAADVCRLAEEVKKAIAGPDAEASE